MKKIVDEIKAEKDALKEELGELFDEIANSPYEQAKLKFKQETIDLKGRLQKQMSSALSDIIETVKANKSQVKDLKKKEEDMKKKVKETREQSPEESALTELKAQLADIRSEINELRKTRKEMRQSRKATKSKFFSQMKTEKEEVQQRAEGELHKLVSLFSQEG